MEYNKRRHSSNNILSFFFQKTADLFMRDRSTEVKLIQGTLQNIQNMINQGYGECHLKGQFDDAVKQSILIGAYITVLDDIVCDYKTFDWHRSVLASLIVEILGGEVNINEMRVSCKNNYEVFNDAYKRFSDLFSGNTK